MKRIQPEDPTRTKAVPTRFDLPDFRELQAMRKSTGLSVSEIIRRAVRFAIPKWKSKEVAIVEVEDFGKGARK